MNQRRVVITALGALTPVGNNVRDFWANLVEGKGGAAPITKFDASKFKTRFACEVKNFNAEDHFDKKESRKMDECSQYALVAVQEAVIDGNIEFEQLNRERIGVIWGTGNGGFRTFEDQVIEFGRGDGVPRFNPFFIPKVIVDTTAGLISIKYGLKGINFCTVSACASASHGIIDAFNYIRWNKADMIITGGSEAAITQASIGGFNALKALSTNNENYGAASRPFDADRDGFVMAEGSGAIVLEEYEHALRRGAKIYAELAGGGMSADAYHMTATHPDGEGAARGMKLALEDANLTVKDIEYINMHATSTPLGDICELKGVRSIFGDRIKDINISATKSVTGHLLGAAGAVESIASVMAVYHDIIPPTINTTNVDPEIDKDFNLTLGKAQKRVVNAALNNTFGFGGHNASIVFKKFRG